MVPSLGRHNGSMLVQVGFLHEKRCLVKPGKARSALDSEARMQFYYLKLYFWTLVAFFAIDMVWLVLVARGFYQKHLGFLMRSNPNWSAAVVFYLLFVLGLLVFVIVPSLETGSTKKALILGALFGLITYATYDLTNLATVKDWPWIVTVVDL
jgi:uncharacterized membrane protein